MARMSRTRAIWVALASVAVIGIAGTAVPALASEEPGTIAGHLTDGGNPVPNSFVTLVDADYNFVAYTYTGADGAYVLAGIPAGSYKLSFSLIGGTEQWAVQKRSFDDADLITVANAETTTVDEAMRPHGAMSGHITNADGTPAPYAIVFASLAGGEYGYGNAQADADGFYTIPYLEPGNYVVEFQKDYNSPRQYANNARNYDDATPIPVSVGATTTLDQTLLAMGVLKGQVTDNGVGVPEVQLNLSDVNGDGYGFAYTDSDGYYQVSLLPGTYTVQVQRPDALVQYAPGKIDQLKAGTYAIEAGAEVILNEALRATGTISGHLTMPDGSPLAGAHVGARSTFVDQGGETDDDGYYQLKVFPGTYSMTFSTLYGYQYAHGRASGELADPISVTAAATTTVDEILADFGSLAVTAKNSATGEPLTSFCAYLDFRSDCTDTGTITFPQISPGRYRLSSYPQEGEDFVYSNGVAVVSSGAQTAFEMSIAPGAKVTTIMTDAKTGAPVANACLELVNVLYPQWLGTGQGQCSDATGAVEVPQVRAGTYKAFVWARDGVHGHQFVGPSGGVGKFKRAIPITLTAGQTVALPPIKLDKAGRITGTVTDEITGAPLKNGTVSLSTWNAGYGGGRGLVPIDRQGHYTMSDLGPYNWTLYFWSNHYASEWSGNAAYRDKAAGIKVRPGQTSTYDTALGAGTILSGKVVGATGTRADFARITVINADTGDEMGAGDVYLSIRRYVVNVKGPQRVKLEYYGSVGPQYYGGYVGGTDITTASVLRIPATGEKRVNVTMTQTNP